MLTDCIPPSITEGLIVTATNPISSYINVSSGKGVIGGKIYELTEDISIPILFTSSILYVNLHLDRIVIDTFSDSSRLTIAKIIVPKPNITALVQDDKDNSFNAYIQNFTQYRLYGNGFGKFEEDTLELLRDNIGEVLADNLIGNIRLSENLKVTNTQGTLELNSDSLILKDVSGNIQAKFNKYGTYYYDDNNIELAKFTRDEARIGNIIITNNSIQSGNYVNEISGFKINDEGYAEFENIRIRGRISSSIFELDKISAVGGKLIVANASTLSLNIGSLDTTITVEDSVFSVNDIIVLKDGFNTEYLKITNISNAPTYTVDRDIANIYSTNPTWDRGIAVVSMGNSASGGFILIDAVTNNSPFIDVNVRNSSIYNDYTTKLRLGNLSGIIDSLYGTLSGYGLYSDNVFLKGKLYAPDIKTALSGERIELTTEGLIAYNSSNSPIFSVLLDSISGIGDEGDIVIGNISSSNYMHWDASTGVLKIRGDLDIGGGLATEVLNNTTGARVHINANGMTCYDDSSGLGHTVFSIKNSGVNEGDVVIGDESLNKFIKWDNSEGLFTIIGSLLVGNSTNKNVVIDGTNGCIKIYGDDVTIDSTNNKIDWRENSTEYSSSLTTGIYTPTQLATHVQTVMRASGSANTNISYDSITRKITITNLSLTTFSLYFNSGTYASATCAEAMGFSPFLDLESSLSYTGDYEVALRVYIGNIV